MQQCLGVDGLVLTFGITLFHGFNQRMCGVSEAMINTWHLKGFTPVWVLFMCTLRELMWAKALGQCLQVKGFSPEGNNS